MHQRGAILEQLVSVITVIYPLTAVPQLYEIWVNKNTSGVSMWTWGLFLLFTIPLLMYCISKKEHKLAMMWSLWLIMYAGIFTGLFLA